MSGDRHAVSLRPVEAAIAERHWPMVLPFHYGQVTVAAFTEIHLSALFELGDGRRVRGHAAELAAPKWFEKLPGITPAQSADRLRLAAERGRALLPALGRQESAAELGRALEAALAGDIALGAAGLVPLERSFGMALGERAALDAICRATGLPFEQAVAADIFGIGAGEETYAHWLATRGAAPTHVGARHTVGLDDPLSSSGPANVRPTTLAEVIDAYGVTSFKVKFNGSEAALERLVAIAALIDRKCPTYRVTLDANEAFTDPAAFADTIARLAAHPELARFRAAIAYVEQPLHRDVADTASLAGLGLAMPVIIDESDGDELAYGRAARLGYAGVSVKTCKGVLRGLRNAARAAAQGGFVTAEDLCVQPGLALQQNLAVAAAIRVTDCERNGHHFGPGPSHLPEPEREALLAQHGDVYAPDRLRIVNGQLALGSTLAAPGLGTVLVPSLG